MTYRRTAVASIIGTCIVITWTMGMLGSLMPQASAGESAAQRRMLRILTGRSEAAKINLIQRLQSHPNQLHAYQDIVAQATIKLLQEHRGGKPQSDQLTLANGSRTATANTRPPVPDTLARLLVLLGNSPREEAIAVLATALDHPDERVVMIAMDTVGQFQIEAAIDDLAIQIKRPEFSQQYAFRFTLVRAIAQLHCPRGIELLQGLHQHLDGQLRHEIAQRLESVDLRDFDGDRSQLASYRRQHPPESFVRPVNFESEQPTPPTSASPAPLQLVDSPSESTAGLKLSNDRYYGIDMHAGRMLFIIDRSGSMKEAAHYANRLQSAKRELIRVITGLHPEDEFSIMLFDTYVQVWRNELLPATEQNKRAAISFTRRITLGDKTNTHAVLSDAIEFDEQLEAVFMLTDGQPTAGKMIQPAAIVRDLVHRNRFRHLKFHTIGFGVNAATSEFLESIAEKTGGEFREAQ